MVHLSKVLMVLLIDLETQLIDFNRNLVGLSNRVRNGKVGMLWFDLPVESVGNDDKNPAG